MAVKAVAGISVDKATADKNTITLRKANATLASFYITPNNGNDSAELDEIVLQVTKKGSPDTYLLPSQLTLDIDGVESDVA
jgi:archaellin